MAEGSWIKASGSWSRNELAPGDLRLGGRRILQQSRAELHNHAHADLGESAELINLDDSDANSRGWEL